MTVLYWLPALLIAGFVLNGVRLRLRLRHLRTLPPESGPVRLQHHFVTAAGVFLDESTRRAASAYAADEGLDVLDLVPGRLPTGRALDLARLVSPEDYRTTRLTPGRGAGHALLVDAVVLERAGIEKRDGLDPVEFAEVTARLKRYACTSTDLAVAPVLNPLPDEVNSRRAMLRAILGGAPWVALTPPPIIFAAIIAGVVASAVAGNPAWGAIAALAFSAQPYLIFSGGPLAPRDLHKMAILRLAVEPLRWLGTIAGTWRPTPKPDRFGELVEQYAAEAAKDPARYFEDRRETCPWCESAALAVRLQSPDLVQRKPGRFTLEECGDCGHVFQNPRLSLTGLDYYYRDFYDGLGEESLDNLFDSGVHAYKDRAEMIRPHAIPKMWLDVGTGHGHFCNVARDSWPETVFDGLDMSDSIEEAERRRWVDVGHRGMFPDLANQLAGRYDVVSMHHYLEHTREPLAELDAARQVLAPGGHLLIEVPNPESRFGRLFGRFWVPWLQPQHQHFVTVGNLTRALEERGFTTVAVDRGSAHIPVDFTGALAMAINGAVPNSRQPWMAKPHSRWRFGAHIAALVAAIPLFILTTIIDKLLALALRGTKGGNAYRVLAARN